MTISNVEKFLNKLRRSLKFVSQTNEHYSAKLESQVEITCSSSFSALLSLYENSITVNVVVPVVPKPFISFEELYNHNYTFVVQTTSFDKVYDWLSDKYNTGSQLNGGFWKYVVFFISVIG